MATSTACRASRSRRMSADSSRNPLASRRRFSSCTPQILQGDLAAVDEALGHPIRVAFRGELKRDTHRSGVAPEHTGIEPDVVPHREGTPEEPGELPNDLRSRLPVRRQKRRRQIGWLCRP